MQIKSSLKFSSIFQGLLIFIFSIALYLNTLQNDYAYDDNNVVVENFLVQKGVDGIPGILTHAYRYGYLGTNTGLYRPLSLITFAIEKQLFNSNPVYSHLINVIIYGMVCLMVFLFLKLLFTGTYEQMPFWITMMFAFHPVHTEVVANIKSRDALMSMLFVMLSAYYLIKSIDEKQNRFLIRSGIFYLLAMLSKETSIVFFVIVPVALFYFRDLTIFSSVKKMFSWGIALGVYFVLVFSNIDALEGGETTSVFANSLVAATTFTQKYATAILILGKYLYLLFIPYPLICDYTINSIPFTNWADYRVILTGILYLLMIFLIVIKFHKKNILIFGMIIYLATIALFSQLFFTLNWTMGERFLFEPSLGFSIIVIYGVFGLLKKYQSLLKPVKVAYLIIPVLILYASKTISRNFDWKNNLTLFETDVQKLPDNARLHLNIAKENLRTAIKSEGIDKKELVVKALASLKKSLVIYPDYATTWLDMGSAYALLGQYEEAIKSFNRALKYDPRYHDVFYNMGFTYKEMNDLNNAVVYLNRALETSKLADKTAKILINLADIYSQTGNHIAAIENGTKAFKILSNDVILHRLGIYYFMYGTALYETGSQQSDLEKKKEYFISAYKQFEIGVKYSPNLHALYNSMGNIAYMLSDFEKALLNYNIVVELAPQKVEPYHNIGVLYSKMGNMEKSNQYLNKAVTVDPKYINSYFNLASNYFDMGNYKESVINYKKILSVRPDIPAIYKNISITYEKLGNKDSAENFILQYKKWQADSSIKSVQTSNPR